MASDDGVPQWKKDLILRKRIQNKCSVTTAGKRNSEQQQQLSCPPTINPSNRVQQAGLARSTFPVSLEPRAGALRPQNEQCNTVKPTINQLDIQQNMVQDSVIQVKCPTMAVKDKFLNGHTPDSDSDTSEELQYGPGIVSKLKSKYLSLTLREKVVKPRGTILNMRRATSLENMLESDSGDESSKKETTNGVERKYDRKFTPNNIQNGHARSSSNSPRYRSTIRTHPDSIKRARSVESIRQNDLINEDVVIIEKGNGDECRKSWLDKEVKTKIPPICNGTTINRPKRITPFIDESEKPPTDHVRHTALLFEGPAVRRTKGPKSTGQVAAKVAAIIDKEKVNKKKPVIKPQITSPKPTINGKSRKVIPKAGSPKKIDNKPDVTPKSPTPDITETPRIISETPDLILHSSPAQNIPSPSSVKKLTEVFIKTEVEHTENDIQPQKTPKPDLKPDLKPDFSPKKLDKCIKPDCVVKCNKLDSFSPKVNQSDVQKSENVIWGKKTENCGSKPEIWKTENVNSKPEIWKTENVNSKPEILRLKSGARSPTGKVENVSKMEHTISKMEHTISKPESMGSKPECMGLKPESMGSKPDSVGIKPDSVGIKPESMGSKPDSMGSKPDSMGSKPDSMGLKPKSMGLKPESMGSKSERMGLKPESMGLKPESMGLKPENVGSKPEKMMSKPESMISKPESMKSKPESMKTKPESMKTKPESMISKPDSMKSKSESMIQKSESTIPKSESMIQKSESTIPKSETMIQKPESMIQKPESTIPKPESMIPKPGSRSPIELSPKQSPSSPIEDDQYDGIQTKKINMQAVKNISQASHTVTFNIPDNICRSHLPKLCTVPVGINRLVPDTTSTKPEIKPKFEAVNNELVSPPKIKERPGIITPLINNRPTVPAPPPPKKEAPKPSKPSPVQKTLTSREITKNLINNVKTLQEQQLQQQQPISKVVVSVRSVEEVVVNNSTVPSAFGKKSPRNQEQKTLLFNFQNRDTVPDYIPNDNIVPVRRGKREKPRSDESGIILLADAPADEFEDDDFLNSLNGPPSPCDVLFENDNVLIDGKSSISKHPKKHKLRIQFNDDATQLFTYPSESSLMEDSPTSTNTTPTSVTTVISNQPGHQVPSLSGSSLSSYQPSKLGASVGFQLGVTSPIVTPPVSTSKEIDTLEPQLDLPVTYSSETNADILF